VRVCVYVCRRDSGRGGGLRQGVVWWGTQRRSGGGQRSAGVLPDSSMHSAGLPHQPRTPSCPHRPASARMHTHTRACARTNTHTTHSVPATDLRQPCRNLRQRQPLQHHIERVLAPTRRRLRPQHIRLRLCCLKDASQLARHAGVQLSRGSAHHRHHPPGRTALCARASGMAVWGEEGGGRVALLDCRASVYVLPDRLANEPLKGGRSQRPGRPPRGVLQLPATAANQPRLPVRSHLWRP
jgi:hypothetical protein